MRFQKNILFQELFYVLTAALGIFIVFESGWPGLVLAYININWVLILWLISGILLLINQKTMINGVIVKNLNKYTDERGWLAEIYRDDELDYQPAMGYVSATKPGIIRGPHEHNFQSDCFVFVGPGSFELHLWDRRDASATKGEYMKMEVGENNPAMVIVPPGVVHGYKAIGDKDAYSINLPDKLYKGKDKAEEIDEIRWEQKEDSPYKIS